jgi:hypothetical protein
MTQFDYLRNQISDNIWAGKEILKIADTVNEGIQGGKDWYMNLPQIKFVMESQYTTGIRDVLLASQDLSETVTSSSLVFLETVHGVNRAFNTDRHKNFTVKINDELTKLATNKNEKAVYEASVMAHNETLNLPELSKQLIAYSDTAHSAANETEKWKNDAIQKALEKKTEFEAMLETLKGNARRSVNSKLNMVEDALFKMGRPSPPKPPRPPKTPPTINGSNPYTIDSVYRHSIVSIHSRPPVLNAIVPIAVGGAATVAGAVSVITGIASWLLGSFFLKALNIPALLLPALTNTVTAIVLKITGSAGTIAARYIAAQALDRGISFLPTIFGITGMRVSGWAYVMSFAAPIIAASVIIIQAMKNRLALAEMLYIFGDLTANPNRFNFVQAYMSDTNKVEILEEFKTSAKRMLGRARLPMSQIIGVGLDSKKKYAVCYNLTNPDSPIQIAGKEAIETVLGADKVARIATGRLGFMDFI